MPDGRPGAAPHDGFFQIPRHAGMAVAEAVALVLQHLRPEAYLQIGGSGELALQHATCPSIVVDETPPAFPEALGGKPACLFMRMNSGQFFSSYDPCLLLNRPLDLALLDGARLFEILLRDFINTERHCKRESVILLTNYLPIDAHLSRRDPEDWRFAHRSPQPRGWAGDLWKIPVILQLYRSDLRMLAFDATPGGLIAVTDLDPRSDRLAKQYFAITDQFRSVRLTQAAANDYAHALNTAEASLLGDAAAFRRLFRVTSGIPLPSTEPVLPPKAPPEPRPTWEGQITFRTLGQLGGPVPGAEDIWQRLHPLLLHWRSFNTDEAKIRAQQYGMVRDGCFLMPSPFGSQPDVCTESYYLPHRFGYRFRSAEEYFWISSSLDDAFALSAIFFPKRRVALCLRDQVIGEKDVAALEQTCADAEAAKPAAAADPRPGKRVVVTGHSHYMHTLWNELPALERAASAGLAGSVKLAAVYQPLGPLAELFPEFGQDTQVLSFDRIAALNRECRLLVGLGSRTITEATQRRLRDVAARHAGAAALEQRDRFRAAHSPVFWFSVKPLGRTCLRQAEVLTHLIAAAKRAYSSAGFILNGTSRPWDLGRNDNYGSWFLEGLEPASAHAGQIIGEVIARLPGAIRSSLQIVSDVSVCDEIVWGAAADFYFCHGGTMQNKIGWIYRIPGMIHSSKQFMDVWKANARVVEHSPPCYFASSEIILDREPETYAAFTRQRAVANYEFTSLKRLTGEFLDAARQSLPAAGAATHRRAGKRRRTLGV